MKRIIQIAVLGESESFYPILFALCEDGTIYQRVMDKNTDRDETWDPVPGIVEKEDAP